MKPGKLQSSKQRGQDGGLKVHDRAHLLFFTHTLCMNYVIAMFPLVSCMNTRSHLLRFARYVQNSAQKPGTKNFAGFHNHLPVLTMIIPREICFISTSTHFLGAPFTIQ